MTASTCDLYTKKWKMKLRAATLERREIKVSPPALDEEGAREVFRTWFERNLKLTPEIADEVFDIG